MTAESNDLKSLLREVLPKAGLVYSERGGLSEVLCKPKIMPLKSAVLEQLQKLEETVMRGDHEVLEEDREEEQEQDEKQTYSLESEGKGGRK